MGRRGVINHQNPGHEGYRQPTLPRSAATAKRLLTQAVKRLLVLLIFVSLPVLVSPAASEELRLDDPAWLARASLIGVDQARTADDSITIRTGSSPSYEAYVVFPVEHQLDPQKHDLLEITMKTDPRIHRFKFLWKAIAAGQPDRSYFVQQEIYRDGAFHTYLVALDIRPSWRGRISEIALGWDGAHGVIEIKRMAIRQGASLDRLRMWWSRFWIPESLNPAMVHAVGGSELFGQPFAWLLALIFAALVPVIVLVYRRGAIGSPASAGTSLAWTSARIPAWAGALGVGFVILWLVYDLREMSTHLQTLKSESRYYLGDAPRPRHHFELDDFYDFMDAIQTVVPPEGSVGFFSSRPLFVKARYFLFPRPVVDRELHPEYLVVFQDPDLSYRRGQLKEKDVVVVDRVTPFGRFGEDAFIYKRNHD